MADDPDVDELRRRLAAAEDTLDAIRNGGVDGLVVTTADGPRIYTLQGADEFYRTLIEQMADGAAVVSADGTILYANRSLARMLGRPLETVVGSAAAALVIERDLDRLMHLLSPLGTTDEAHLRLCTESADSPLHVGVTVRTIVNAGSPTTCLIVSDRTADIEAERIRRDAEVLTDRERVARDLHDTVIQSLFAMGLQLESMQAGLDPAAVGQLELIVDSIDQTIRELRQAIFDLKPPTLVAGLTESIERIAVAAEHGLGYAAELTIAGDLGGVPDSAVGDLLATLREALSNAARHAHATRVQVHVTVTGTELVLTVDDDGLGIDPARSRSGLNNLKVRAEAHRGTFTTSSEPGRPGTVLRWAIPLVSA